MPFFAATFGLVAALCGAATLAAKPLLFVAALPDPSTTAMVAAGFSLIVGARRSRSLAVAD